MRRFTHSARVGLADAAPDGRARFDAIARWLQDAAFADVLDAGLSGNWVVRRTSLRVERFPRFGEELELVTFCSGLGRMWAERTTTLPGVKAVALWVHVDEAGRPRPLDAEQLAVWEPSTGGRRVKARLRHEGPPAGAPARAWTFRRADLDVAAHVNNAAYWEVLEELADPPEPVTAEIEYRGAADAGEAEVLCGDGAWWITRAGEVHASLTLSA